MSKNVLLASVVGAAGVALLSGTALAAVPGDNPFATTELSAGYQLAEEGKCGEGKCGEGKCGEDKKKEG